MAWFIGSGERDLIGWNLVYIPHAVQCACAICFKASFSVEPKRAFFFGKTFAQNQGRPITIPTTAVVA